MIRFARRPGQTGRSIVATVGGSLVALALALGAPDAHAYKWYDKDGTQTQGCVTCHNGFLGGNGTLHAQHRNLLGDPTTATQRCNLCHPNGGGTTPVLTYTSGPVGGLTNGYGCSGCHGQIYGETSPNSGLPKSTSYGLRQIHVDLGYTQCGTGGCHAPGSLGANDPFPARWPESVAPPYFADGFSILRDPCNSAEEDMASDVDTVGLDNDGDGLRDYPNDPDCAPPTTTTTTTLPPFDCAPAPVAGCEAPAKATFLVNEKVAGKEKIKVVFTKLVNAVSQSEFGNPAAGTTKYNVCVYDSADQLRGQYTVDRAGDTCSGKPCWATVPGKGFKYNDKLTAADGIQKISVSGGDAGKGKVVVIGKSVASSMPTGVAAVLEGQSSATVQVITSDASCFGMTLPTVKKADGQLFQAIAP